VKTNTLKFDCSEHGRQEFSAFAGQGRIALKCGCTWYANGEGLAFERTLPHSEMWWEQTEAERIKYSNCATSKCRRKVEARYNGDYWCAIDLKRIKLLHKVRGK
jgi:hypothetical protein